MGPGPSLISYNSLISSARLNTISVITDLSQILASASTVPGSRLVVSAETIASLARVTISENGTHMDASTEVASKMGFSSRPLALNELSTVGASSKVGGASLVRVSIGLDDGVR